MSATVDYSIFKHHKKTNGTINVEICVTLNRDRSYITTEHNVTEKKISKGFKTIKNKFVLDEINITLAKFRKEITLFGAGYMTIK